MTFFTSEPERPANIAKHGFDPADFEDTFDFDRFVTIPTRSSHTGRELFKLIGTWHGVIVVVAMVSPLGNEAIDVVSTAAVDTRKARAV